MHSSNTKYGTIGNIVLEDDELVTGRISTDIDHISRSNKLLSNLSDKYDPPFYSISRRSTRIVAVFNLLSTIVGGGTLSLPFAFSKCGWLGGSILVMISIFISIVSLQTLCVLSRKLGTSKYSEVMEKSIGAIYGDIANLLIVFMLIFVVIAFMILEKDIAGDILDYILGYGDFGKQYKSAILVILTILSFPVMIAKSLYALRHVSYLGTSSVCLLLIVIIIKSCIVNYKNPTLFQANSRLGPESAGDVLYALPIILIAFLCQFNVLGVYSNLYNPHPERINQVLHYSIGGSGIIYILFGVSGYLFAYDHTMDNILNNFSSHDPSLIIARIGLLLTIICQIPMVVVPCRDSVIQIITKYQKSYDGNHNSNHNHINGNYSSIDQKYTAIVSIVSDSNVNGTNGMNTEFESQSLSSNRTYSLWNINNYTYASECTTFLIVIFCLILSECVPGVATIWSLAGSSISLILAFFLPSKAYMSFIHSLNSNPSWTSDFYIGFSRAMIYISLAMIGLCTYQAVMKL